MTLPIKTPAGVVNPPAAAQAQAQAQAQTPTPAGPAPPKPGKTGFSFYVEQECRRIVGSNPEHTGIKFSTDVKRYLSDLIIEFIKRIATQVGFNPAAPRKTINSATIMRAVEKLLVDGKQPVETLTYIPATVVDPRAKKAEANKRREQKALGVDYKYDIAALGKVEGYAVVKTVSFPDSGFDALKEAVDAVNDAPSNAASESAGEPSSANNAAQ